MNQPPASSHFSPSTSTPNRFSLRVKLILGNALVLLIAATLLGYYIFNRLNTINAAQSEQLYQNILEQTRTNILATANIEANQLNNFFIILQQNVILAQKSTENLLSQENILDHRTFWDARQNLTRLGNGSWDNPNSEMGAIYLPGKNELTDSIVAEINTLKELDRLIPILLTENPDTLAIYFGSTNGTTLYYPNIDLAAILPPDFDVTQRPWFTAAAPAANPDRHAVWSTPYLDAAQNGLVITVSAPVYDKTGTFRGVIAMDIQLKRMTTLISGIQVGKNGYAVLLDSTNRVIAMPPAAYADFGIPPDQSPLGNTLDSDQLSRISPEFRRILAEMNAGKSGVATFILRDSNRFIAYSPIPEVRYNLAIIAPANELLATTITARETLQSQLQQIATQSIVLISVILVIALLATFGFSNSIIAPLGELTRTAQKISAGEFIQVHTQSRDELGTLAHAFNTMTATLQELIQSLEQRVAERTAQLEAARLQSEKRAHRVEVISQVGRAISQESNLDQLLPFITQLVSEKFNFYHVGIFLLDNEKQYAVLRAANSEGGKRMLARGHRLEVGQTGIVGYVAGTGQPRIALDVGADAVFFNNPDLPQTRSEMALPLMVSDQIIGVLDVQSTEAGAFTEEDINTFSTLADQIAIAIDNAYLLDQTQKALRESQAFYRQYLQQGWRDFTGRARKLGYYKSLAGGKFVETITLSESSRQALEKGEVVIQKPTSPDDSEAVIVPIKLRDQVLGVLHVKATESGYTWQAEEIKIIQAISERLALALENARLFEETSRRAERERLVSEITSRIRSTNNPNEMIKTAIQELKNALGASRVEIIPQKVSHETDREEK